MPVEPGTEKSWKLSVYEVQRKPQKLPPKDAPEVKISPSVIQNELMCPICLDMLKTTMTTKECLHRFCQDCIVTALRSDKTRLWGVSHASPRDELGCKI